MKLIVLFCFVGFSNCFSQLPKSRWISIKPTLENADLFGLDTTDKLDIVSVIKLYAQNRRLDLFHEAPKEYINRFLIRFNYLDSLKSYRNSYPDSWLSDPFFEAGIFSDSVLQNSYGEDSLQMLSNGEIVAIYPNPTPYEYRTSHCSEIRIKEVKGIVTNFQTKSSYYPVEIAFCIDGKVKFWMNLSDLFDVIDFRKNYKWYDFIINQQYKGFQYMQEEE